MYKSEFIDVTTGISAAVIIATLTFGLLSPPRVQAQSPQPAATAPPSFEVAAIKPNKADDLRVMLRMTPDGLSAVGVPVKFLIEFAYDIKDFQISGGPGWTDSEKYDIDAKMDESTIEAIKNMPRDQAVEQRRLMVQSLLADRFKLKVTRSSKELPIYALVVAKNGPKLTKSADSPAGSTPRNQMRFTPGELTGMGVPITLLVNALAREVGRQVVDKTGLQGNYDFTLRFTSERRLGPPGGPAGPGGPGGPGDAPAPDSSGPSVFTALQEQLGLKLDPQKGPVETLIIDSIERPSDN